jgi:DNA polymerase/3'-5' exonuclease PolX
MRFGLADRMSRYAGTGALAINKRIAEKLFLKMYDLELALASPQRIWAYRKATWPVEECQESLAALYEKQGEAGLRTLPAIGPSIAVEISHWLLEERDELVRSR